MQDIVVYEIPSKYYKFIITYFLKSLHFNLQLYLTTYIKSSTFIASSNLLYPNSEWLEREIWDLFGISFLNHVDLRRLLNDYGFKGHPLLKNFPLIGYFEIFYNEKYYMLTYNNIELTQEYKNFLQQTTW